jgi:hypothetical protein
LFRIYLDICLFWPVLQANFSDPFSPIDLFLMTINRPPQLTTSQPTGCQIEQNHHTFDAIAQKTMPKTIHTA